MRSRRTFYGLPLIPCGWCGTRVRESESRRRLFGFIGHTPARTAFGAATRATPANASSHGAVLASTSTACFGFDPARSGAPQRVAS